MASTDAPYQELQDSDTTTSPALKEVAVSIRLGFVRKVYGILSVQLLLTCAIAAPLAVAPLHWIADHLWWMVVSLVFYIAIVCAAACCRSTFRTFPYNYIMLAGITVSMSILVGFISSDYTWQSVVLAAGMTAGVFLGLTVYAWRTEKDFTGFGPYLIAFGLSLAAFGGTIWLLSWFGVHVRMLTILYDLCGVLLFSCYTVYDTQLMLGEFGGHSQQFGVDDYCWAALQLYLDIINLFLYILELVGSRRDD